jgi:hypothetical protein
MHWKSFVHTEQAQGRINPSADCEIQNWGKKVLQAKKVENEVISGLQIEGNK